VGPDPLAAPAEAGTEDDDRPRPRGKGAGGDPLPWTQLPVVVGPDRRGPDEARREDDDLLVPQRLPRALRRVADTPFAALGPDQLARLDDWLRAALRQWPTRASRRLEPHPAGRRVSLRRTVAGARRTGFEPVRLQRTRPVRRPRRLLMLCDV